MFTTHANKINMYTEGKYIPQYVHACRNIMKRPSLFFTCAAYIYTYITYVHTYAVPVALLTPTQKSW
jgi:hypothetical protein